MKYLLFSSLPKTCIFMIWTSRKFFIRLGHATDQKCHLGLICLRIFKMRWVLVVNDHLGPEPLISDSATRRSLWPLQCQSVAMDDEWQISKALIQSSIQTHGKSVRSHILTFFFYFDIFHILTFFIFWHFHIFIFWHWHFWKSYCWLRLIWGLDHRSRSRRSRYILPGAGAGAGAAEQFYSEPEPEPEPECFPGAGAGAGADQKCHGSASLLKSTSALNEVKLEKSSYTFN